MTTWDDVGGHPAPGQPDQIRSVANYFGELSVAARFARIQLAALQRGELRACWTGVAADAFASELEILPADLGKLETSLDHASTAVHRWATTVDSAQYRADAELRTYGTAEQQLLTARYERDRERAAALNDAITDPAGTIGDLISGNNRLAPYERRVDDATDQVRRIQNHIDQIRHDVDATARTVASLLDEASRLGIQNKGFFQKVGEFLSELGEALIVVLKFLDELVDLIAPWVGMALLILSFVNPVFAFVAVGFAALDFGLTASRALLGDDEVTALDLLDDGIDLGLALLGAKGANAGLGLVDDFGRAANEGSKLIKATDTALNVIGGAKAVGDYYLNLGGLIGVGPGSTFDLIVDVSSGDTSGWAPGEGPAPAADFIDATGGVIDLVTGGGDTGGGGGSAIGAMSDIGGGGMPDVGGGGGGMPDVGGGVPGGDMGGMPDVGGGVPGGDMGSSQPDVGGLGGSSSFETPATGEVVADSAPTFASNDAPTGGLVADAGPASAPSAPSDAPTSGLVADSALPSAPGDAAAGPASGGSGDGVQRGAVAAAGAIGLGAAVAGAKRRIDNRTEPTNTPDDSPAARQALIGTSEFVLSEITESPHREVARIDIEEAQEDEGRQENE